MELNDAAYLKWCGWFIIICSLVALVGVALQHGGPSKQHRYEIRK